MLSRYQNITTSLPFPSRKALRTTCGDIAASMSLLLNCTSSPEYDLPQLQHPVLALLLLLVP